MEKKNVVFSAQAGYNDEYYIQIIEMLDKYKVLIYPSRKGLPAKGRTLKQYMWVSEDELIKTAIRAVIWCNNRNKRRHDTGFDKRWPD